MADVALLAVGRAVALVGGYALGWNWTGYARPGNDSLRARLQMLLVP